MQMRIIGEWLIDGRSPHTGMPVTETCRIVKLGQDAWYFENGDIRTIHSGAHRRLYEVGDTYAIQPGRGKPAIGRTPPLVSIKRQDVRAMTQEDARRRGFASVRDYLLVWTRMHSKQSVPLMEDADPANFANHLTLLQMCPLTEFEAWVLRFAEPSIPATPPAAPLTEGEGLC